jgi:hypothetical protein
MRCLLLFFLLGASFSYAQGKHAPMDSLYDTKWYLNLIELYEFGSDDTSTSMVTSVYEVKYIIFSDQLIFGSNSSPDYQKEDDLQYDAYHLISYDGNRKYANLYTYETKRDLRKGKPGADYTIYMKSNELRLTSSGESSQNLLSGVHEGRIYYFSRTYDSLQISSNILGSWKFDNLAKSMNFDSMDTLSLSKTRDVNQEDTNALIVFQIQYGETEFYHNLEIPENKKASLGFAPDPYYVSHSHRPQTFPYVIDLEKQLLILHGDFGSYTFRIINIQETEMTLVKI